MRTEASKAKRRQKTKAPGVYKSVSGNYEICFRDSDGKLRFQTIGDSFEEAKAARADIVAKMSRGQTVRSTRLTFAELAETWFEAKSPRLRERSRRYYRDALDAVLLPRFGKMLLPAVNADAIAKLVRDLEREGLRAVDRKRPRRPLGRSSIDNYLKPLRQVLALAVRRGLIPVSPFSIMTEDDRPKREEPRPVHEWTPEDVEALLAASRQVAKQPHAKADYTPLLRLVATLGLRLGEVLGLRWEDFDKAEGVLYVRRQWLQSGAYGPTKTKAAERRIALPADVRDDLIALRLRSRFSSDDDPVFASAVGTPLGHRNVERRAFEAARDAAGLPDHLTFHDLRHAAASRLIRARLDPVTVAGVLGHEDATTTLRVYAHVFDRQRTDEEVRKALAASS